jgi:hypothetical protein
MNFALVLAVAGLAFSAARVFVTSPGVGDGDANVVPLKDAVQVGLVRLPLAQALEGYFLVAEGLQEGERELLGIERPFGERRDGLFNLNSVHSGSP